MRKMLRAREGRLQRVRCASDAAQRPCSSPQRTRREVAVSAGLISASIAKMVGTPGKPVTPSSTTASSTCAGKAKERSSTSRAPSANAHDQLVEAVVEGERQHAEDHVVLAISQVGADGGRRREHVAVGEHHALGLAGGARGVDDRRQVDVDVAAAGGGAPARHLGERLVPATRTREARDPVSPAASTRREVERRAAARPRPRSSVGRR